MPRPRVENKKQVVTIRLAPELTAEVRRYAQNFTMAVEQGLTMWLKRERRKAEPGSLARHLAPPTAQEIPARKGKTT